jgi:hypothetical protein
MTTNTTSINISRQNVTSNCDLKCAYNFKYPETSLTANNEGALIIFNFDQTNTPPVVYNQQKYNVENMMLITPSMHTFNGATTNAELLISHTPVLGGNQLAVCIPINQSSDSNAASNLVTDLIQSVATNAPAVGETTTINIEGGFTLNKIVPNKPFYSYTDNNNGDYIVFDNLDGIALNSDTLSSLTQIIKPFPLPTPGGNLFYNKNGPNLSNADSGIYIKCKPTGSSSKEVPVEYAKNNTQPFSFTNFLNNSTFKMILNIFISLLIFLIIFSGISHGYSYLTGNPINITGFITQLVTKNKTE